MSAVSRSVRGVVIGLFSCALCIRADAQGRIWPSDRPPQPLPAREIKFPPYEVQTLPNGLHFVYLMLHELEVVTMLLLVSIG